MRLFAISDLHLSFGVDKPMDVFGDHWVDHAARIQASWDARIGPEDWVLVGGDTSWGLNLREAQPDLDWLGERPGKKVLIKGNHCTWWDTLSKVRRALHPSVTPLHCSAVRLDDGTVVVGARLWDPPEAPWAGEGAEKIYRREVERLRLSIEAGRKLGGSRTIALIHYPPRYADGRVTEAVGLLEEAGVEACIYGHLHGKDHRYGFQGEAGGIRYYLTACDAIDFAPIEIPLGG
ncbi:MAG: metallophosphoesterase [Planctomycetota bacterium]|jgi:predicted phosphohydrolase